MAGSTARCGLMLAWILAVLLVNFANSTEYLSSETCGGVIDIGNGGGTLYSQLGLSYENDLDCTVTLRTSPGRRILLTFERFVTEGSSPCSSDYLELFDSDMSSIRKLCGTSLPGDITSLNNDLILQFRTDSYFNNKGFFLAYTSFASGTCDSDEFRCDNYRCINEDLKDNSNDNCGDNSDESSDYLSSECGGVIDIGNGGGTLYSQPGLSYADDFDCTVTLRTSSGRRILLTFKTFETEGFSPCSFDYLELFDSDMSSIRKLCGYNLPGDITSLNNDLILQLKTDSSGSFTGFSLAYTSFSSGTTCDSDEFRCDNGRCIDEDLKENLDDNCGDYSDESSIIDVDIDDAIGTATGLLKWGIGVLVAIVIGIIASIVLVCVCVSCLCFHVCCKSSPPQRSNAVVLTSASQQPGGQVVYNQPPPAYNQSAPYGQPTTAPYGQPATAPYGPPTTAPYAPPI